MRRRPLAILFSATLLAGCVMPASDPDQAFIDEPTRYANLRSYDEIWQQYVPSTYLNPMPYGPTTTEASQLPRVNWGSIAADYRPRVESAGTQGDARAAMRESLERLNQSHFALLPAALTVDEGQAAFQPRESTVGLSLRLIGDGAVVSHVEPQSAAADAGVRPGWVLAAIDDAPVRATIADLQSALPQDALARLRLLDHLNASINRGIESRVRLTFGDANDRRIVKTLIGRPVTDDGPDVDARELEPGIAYFRCGSFLDPAQVTNTFSGLLSIHPNARGLIVDLRGNPGGLTSTATELLGHLIDADQTKIGVLIRRDGGVPLIVDRHEPFFHGAVIVLVDGGTRSAAEIFARAIQDLHRGQVVGEPTPGIALPNVVVRLTNGSRMQFAPADYVSVGGARLETVGVTPDQPVRVGRDDYLVGRDPILDAARTAVRSQR